MEQGLNKVLPSERMSTNTIPHSSELGQTCPSGYQNPSAPTGETELAKRRAECLPGSVISLREARSPASAALAQVWPGDWTGAIPHSFLQNGLYMKETSCSACAVVRDLSWPHGLSRRDLVWVPDVPAVEGFGDVPAT